MKPIRIADMNYDQCVNQTRIPIMLAFGGIWDYASRQVFCTLDTLAEKYDKMLLIGFVEHEQSPDLFTMHEISELPTVIIFEDGKPYRPLVGEYTIQKVEAYIRRFFGLYPYEI